MLAPWPRVSDEAPETPEVPALLEVSVIVPSLNEEPTLAELTARIHAVLADVGRYEIIVVDDGSSDATWDRVAALHAADSRVRGIRLRRQFGKATALSAGFRRARGRTVVILDADLQDDPSDMPAFLAKIQSGFDVVVGWKKQRRDPFGRRLQSAVFNAVLRWATGLALHDANCGFKAFRSEVLRTLPVYGDLFRYIAAFAAAEGYRIAEVPITHHKRPFGRSRYGLERIPRGFFDLLSIIFLTRFAMRPMHLFGAIALALAGVGVGTESYLTILWLEGHKIGDRPLLLLGALEIILGIQFFSTGLVAEFLTYTAYRRDVPQSFPVRDEIGSGKPESNRAL